MTGLLIVLVVLVALVVIGVPIRLIVRAKVAADTEAVGRWSRSLRERLLIPPECITFSRAGRFGVTHTSAVVALTVRHVLVKPLFETRVPIPLAEVAGVSEAKRFRGSCHATGSTYVVLRLRDGKEVALLAREPRRWSTALRRRLETR
ncbi:MAG: hypothetical protein GX774_10510 [Armatimonadetes bacterium]|jgi:hypothetical protein|nr:hypothetical protein [Armatimonadota bacterium]